MVWPWRPRSKRPRELWAEWNSISFRRGYGPRFATLQAPKYETDSRRPHFRLAVFAGEPSRAGFRRADKGSRRSQLFHQLLERARSRREKGLPVTRSRLWNQAVVS